MFSKIFGSQGLLAKKLPNFEWRPAQLEMANRISQALQGHKIIVEAGTGTGKTFAYLIPAFLSGKKVVISTGTKSLQDQLYYKDIPLIERILGKKLRAIYLKGRRNYICLWRWQQKRQGRLFLEQEGLFQTLKDWLEQTEMGDIADAPLSPEWPGWTELTASAEQCLGQNCPLWHDCFITRLRLEAQKAQLIIVNHYLFMADLAIKEKGGQVIPRYEAIIFDEAHQLEETVSEYFGLQVSNFRIEDLIKDVCRLYEGRLSESMKKVTQDIQGKTERFFGLFAHIKGRESLSRIITSPLLEKQGETVCRAIDNLEEFIHKANTSSEIKENLTARIERIKNELSFICKMAEPDYAYWAEKKKRNVVIGCSPIRADLILQEKLYPFVKSIIFTSATLNTGDDFAFFKARLGLPQDTEGIVLPSPFDYQKQALLYLPPSMPDPNTPAFPTAAAKEILKLIQLSQGRALILFTSIQNMKEIYQIVAPQMPYQSFIQGEYAPHKLLAMFKQDIHSVLFATASFWEGIDVPGEALSCVIIDRLPFAVPEDPLVKTRTEVLRQMGKNPFWDYQIPQAIITLKQGLGRLIRHCEDKGVMAILDPRLHTKSYGKRFLNNLPPCKITQDLQDVARFFKSH
ncbi:MAG: ATP-dependent DNA helicase [Candidatus Desulfofervidaceae bacterium]|nr:ATP-dependent DNA helicase [Candidatus Desulfofervidaceae bacterium]